MPGVVSMRLEGLPSVSPLETSSRLHLRTTSRVSAGAPTAGTEICRCLPAFWQRPGTLSASSDSFLPNLHGTNKPTACVCVCARPCFPVSQFRLSQQPYSQWPVSVFDPDRGGSSVNENRCLNTVGGGSGSSGDGSGRCVNTVGNGAGLFWKTPRIVFVTARDRKHFVSLGLGLGPRGIWGSPVVNSLTHCTDDPLHPPHHTSDLTAKSACSHICFSLAAWSSRGRNTQ